MQIFTCPEAHSLPHTVVSIVCSEGPVDVPVGALKGQGGSPGSAATSHSLVNGFGPSNKILPGFSG